MIVCLRRARAWGLMSETLHMQDSSAPIWTKILSALSSPEQQVCVCNCIGLPPVCLSVGPSTRMFVFLSVHPSGLQLVCVCLFTRLSASGCPSVCPCPVCPPMCLSVSPSVCLQTCLSLQSSASVCLSVCCLSVCLSVHPCPCLSVCLLCVLFCLSVHPWVCLSINPPADLSLHYLCLSLPASVCVCLSICLYVVAPDLSDD